MDEHELVSEADSALGLGQAALWRGDLDEALTFAARAYQLAFRAGDAVRGAAILDFSGDALTRRGEVLEARKAYAAALDIYRQLGSVVGGANVELSLGHIEERVGNLVGAHTHFESALNGYRETGRTRGEAQARMGLGAVAGQQNRLEHARHHQAAALAIFEQLGDRIGLSNLRYQIAVLNTQNKEPSAVQDCAVALRMYEEVGDELGQANAHFMLAQAKLHRGDRSGAGENLGIALHLYNEVHSAYGLARSLEMAGNFKREDGEFREAISFFEGAERFAAQAGDPGRALWLCFLSGEALAASGAIDEGRARAERARRELLAMPQSHWHSRVAVIDRRMAAFPPAVGLAAERGSLCVCGSGKPFQQCHGAYNDTGDD